MSRHQDSRPDPIPVEAEELSNVSPDYVSPDYVKKHTKEKENLGSHSAPISSGGEDGKE